MSTGLFYAYVKNFSIPDYFASRDVADSWWRAIVDSVMNGYQKFSTIRRVSSQFYTHATTGPVYDTVTDQRCAINFAGRVMFTLLSDRDQRAPFSVAPVIPVTDHISGEGYFIRSAVQPNMFWYWDGSGSIRASTNRRTRFTIRIADKQKPLGTIMIGSDDVIISVDYSANVGISLNRDAKPPVQPSAKGDEVALSGTLVAEGPFPVVPAPITFKFADFSGGFQIEYNKVGETATIRRDSGGGERWIIL
ncbi:hypothetical protein BD779DRAFT_1675984 [Infundibulicybe gibba]|nr:hypothetical protein BD779DRAFT_1675984 [Infundibulicybe gibba]